MAITAVNLFSTAVATSTSNNATLVSGTFTVTAGALLCIAVSGNGNGAGVSPTPATISSSTTTAPFAQSLTWTTVEVSTTGGGSLVGAVLFMARVGASEANRTVTVTFAGNMASRTIIPFEVVGGDLPVVQSDTEVTFATTGITATLASATALSSIKVGVLGTRGTTTAITPQNGYTELHEQTVSTNHRAHVQYLLNDTDNTSVWSGASGTFGVNGTVAILVEIPELVVASGITRHSMYYKRQRQ